MSDDENKKKGGDTTIIFDNSETNIDNSVTNIDNSVTNTFTDNSVTNISYSNTNTSVFLGGYHQGFSLGNVYLYGYTDVPYPQVRAYSYQVPDYQSYNVAIDTDGIPVVGGFNITGLYERDILVGGTRNDVIRSGYGQDILIGNAGADAFVLNADHGTPFAAYADVVVDLRAEEGDYVRLLNINPSEVYYDRIGVALGSTEGLARPDTFYYRSENGQGNFSASVVGIEPAVAVVDSRNGNVLGLVLGSETPTLVFG